MSRRVRLFPILIAGSSSVYEKSSWLLPLRNESTGASFTAIMSSYSRKSTHMSLYHSQAV